MPIYYFLKFMILFVNAFKILKTVTKYPLLVWKKGCCLLEIFCPKNKTDTQHYWQTNFRILISRSIDIQLINK